MKNTIILSCCLLTTVFYISCSKNSESIDTSTESYVEETYSDFEDELFPEDSIIIDDVSGFKYSFKDYELTVVKYFGTENINIPASYQGAIIKKLYCSAFENSQINSLIINYPLDIDFCTFQYSTVKTVVIGDSDFLFNDTGSFAPYCFANSGVESFECYCNMGQIETYMFEDCTDLLTVKLDYSLSAIYDYAFSNCTNLKDIYLPGTVSFIADTAFENCNKELIFHGVNDTYAEEWVKENGFIWQGAEL